MKLLDITITLIIMKIVFVVVLIIAAIVVITKCSSTLEHTINEYDTIVGKQVVISDDTLLIIDYAFINSSVILEDGREIRYSFAKTVLIKDNK